MGRYRVYRQGPGDGSTYAECWGSTASSPGRLVSEHDDLDAARRAAALESDGDTDQTAVMIRDTSSHAWL